MRIARVTDLEDPRVSDYRNVRDADLLASQGLFMAEGRKNVKRLLEGSSYRTRSVFVTPAGLEGLRSTLEAGPSGLPVYLAPQSVLNGVVGYDMHRGCLAAGGAGDGARLRRGAAGAPATTGRRAALGRPGGRHQPGQRGRRSSATPGPSGWISGAADAPLRGPPLPEVDPGLDGRRAAVCPSRAPSADCVEVFARDFGRPASRWWHSHASDAGAEPGRRRGRRAWRRQPGA